MIAKFTRLRVALLVSTLPAALAAAPLPKEQLLKPPADAAHYLVASDAGKHGEMWRWTRPEALVKL